MRLLCVPAAPHPRQRLVLPGFQIVAILTGVQWYHIVALICVSPRERDVQSLCHPCTFSGEVSNGVFGLFFTQVICLLTVEF